jgi:bacterioferritin-associated ferredoxin
LPSLGVKKSMDKNENVCVCHRVSLGKIQSYIVREEPKVASQLSNCLDSGTSCGWCIPFLKKLHKLHSEGMEMDLNIDHEKYTERRDAYKQRKCTHEDADG